MCITRYSAQEALRQKRSAYLSSQSATHDTRQLGQAAAFYCASWCRNRTGRESEGIGEGGRCAGGSSHKNLHAMVAVVSHDDAPVAVDGDAAVRTAELPVTRATAANGANMGAVGVPQHLHAMIAVFNNNKVTGSIERDA